MEKTNQKGLPFKEVTSSQLFPTYEEATAYISKQTSGSYKIVGNNPFVSPVPLEKLKHYKLIYDSSVSVVQPDEEARDTVKIFEYN